MQIYEAIRLGNESLAKWELIGWKVKINNRLTRALGRCCYTTKTIELQGRYVKDNTVEQVTDTILHEIAHALAGPRAGHGMEWKMWAVRVGATPQATVDCATINYKRKYQLAFVKSVDGFREYERLNHFTDRRVSLAGKFLKDRPETLNQLVWLENK